jgi:23S rRNA (uracil1939-C5)-methyltransferase
MCDGKIFTYIAKEYLCNKMRKKFKQIEIQNIPVLEMSTDGRCIAKHEELVIFIEKDAAPGDIVDLLILRKKKNYAEARIVKHIHLSPERQTPACEHFGTCGGCKWQHINYSKQLDFKQKEVQETLRRLGKIALPDIETIAGSSEQYMYRNKLDFTFSNKRWLTVEEIGQEETLERNALGFHIPGRFDKILNVNTCHLQADPSNEIRNSVNAFCLKENITYFDMNSQEGEMRNLIIRTSTTGDLMVIVQFAHTNENSVNKVMEFLKVQFPQITSLLYIINEKRNETFQDQEVHCYAGLPYIEESMEGLRFRIGPKSFYQTNSKQAYTLYTITREFAAIKANEVVYDLYTGTGTIANFVAKQAQKVVGIEYVPTAIEDAHINSEINGIKNTSFFAGDMKMVLTPEFIQTHGKADVVITDPPRAGMDKEVIDRLLEMAPDRIVYVSCNPGTQARDLQLLDAMYEVKRVKPVDMFPQTHHVENVVLLKKR